jgi:hypothetical protein
MGTNMENLTGTMWYSVLSLSLSTSKEVWQYVAVCCGVVQCGAVCCREKKGENTWENLGGNRQEYEISLAMSSLNNTLRCIALQWVVLSMKWLRLVGSLKL